MKCKAFTIKGNKCKQKVVFGKYCLVHFNMNFKKRKRKTKYQNII